MPKQSVADLRAAVEAAAEITPEHREELLKLIESLDQEVGAAGEAANPQSLKEAIDGAQEAVRRKGGEEDPDLSDRLQDFEERVERVAVEHPVIASVLTAISRLI